MEKKHNLAGMLTELANLHQSAAAITRLQEKYPGFLPEAPSFQVTFRYVNSDSGKALPLDVPEKLHYVLWLRIMVCQLWTGNPDSGCLRELEQVLLSGRPGLSSNAPFARSLNAPPLSGIIGVDWKHRAFVYRPQTLLQEALHFLMQQSPKAKICCNPDCPAPYFIAPRSNARYCSGDCLQAVQRAAKRKWWEEKGTDWRKRQKKQSQQKAKVRAK